MQIYTTDFLLIFIVVFVREPRHDMWYNNYAVTGAQRLKSRWNLLEPVQIQKARTRIDIP